MKREEKKLPIIKLWHIFATLSLISGALAYLCYQYSIADFVGFDSGVTGFRAAIIAALSLSLTAFLLWCPPKALLISLVRRDAVGAAARRIARNWDSLAEANQPGGNGKIALGRFSHNLGVLKVHVKHWGTCSNPTWEDYGQVLAKALSNNLGITPDTTKVKDDGMRNLRIPLLVMDATKEQP